VVATLTVFVLGVLLIGNQRMLFHRTYRLYAQFENVGGLGNGAEVRVGGIHEGTVKAIALPNRPDGKVIVEMQVGQATHHVIKADSVASIQAEGLVGDKYVAISFGSKGGADVRNGDTIQSEPPVETAALVKKADGILDDLQGITSKINQGAGTAGALVNDKALYKKVDATATALNEDAEALQHNFLFRGFFKKRGYEDSEAMARNEIRQLPAGPYSRKFTFAAKQLFDKPDSARLKHEKALDEPGQFLESNPFGLAVIAAHSSMKGDSAKDLETTQAQAAVVRDYLVNNFKLADTRIKTMGLGKSHNATAGDGVDIIVYPK